MEKKKAVKKTVKKTTKKKPETLKVGDWVKVVKKVKSWKWMDGKEHRFNEWCDIMDKHIGKTRKIKEICNRTEVQLQRGDGYFFPKTCLKKVPAPRKKPIVTKKAVEAVADKIIDAMPSAPVMWKTPKPETRWEKVKKVFRKK